ncbi:MAG: helix-turn-helix transcriptional regulator, partial [Lachnospiraceae bacterium]|nr:helix-turn-helix transcriptional regulator [Lachnospiraceae bacterium]
MEFSKCLKEYMDAASLSASQLAESAGISVSSVSRYLSGKQIPGEEALRRISSCLAAALLNSDKTTVKRSGEAADRSPMTEKEMYSRLRRSASGIKTDYETCIENLKRLLDLLEVSNNELARLLAYDPSHISRILSGSRRPSNPSQFMSDVSDYLGRKFYDTAQVPSILSTTGFDGDISGAGELSGIILDWLGQPPVKEAPQIAHFLNKLDEFDLNEFMASIHFDDIKVLSMPFQLPGAKTYTGIKEMMQAEIDFMKYAVLSRSGDDVIFYSDMPMEEMSEDEEFPKKWMMGMALMIRKGLDLQVIHDVHRPLPEMLLGLEGWIPMYMTGQVHPYYLSGPTNRHFMHFIRSAGTVAISGEAIWGHHANGRYTVTRSKDDVAYYRQRANDLLQRAKPLMEIYKEPQAEEFRRDLRRTMDRAKTLHSLSNVPPLFTMSEDLLEEELSHNDISASEKDRIRDYHKEAKELAASKRG